MSDSAAADDESPTALRDAETLITASLPVTVRPQGSDRISLADARPSVSTLVSRIMAPLASSISTSPSGGCSSRDVTFPFVACLSALAAMYALAPADPGFRVAPGEASGSIGPSHMC